MGKDNITDNIYNNLISTWGNEKNRGKGAIYITRPLLYEELILKTIQRVREKNPFIKILIVTNEYSERKIIADYFSNCGQSLSGITLLTRKYFQPNYTIYYKLIISVGINKWTNSSNDGAKDIFGDVSAFKMMILTDDVSTEDYHLIATAFNFINSPTDRANINAVRMLLPVEEEWIETDFADDATRNKYNEYEEYIRQTINIFGDFETIAKVRKGFGDKSSEQIANEIAEYNGWSNTLDMSIPFNVQIDRMFNPITIRERASTCYNIIRERQLLVTDAECKLPVINDLARRLVSEGNQVLIVSKRGEYATAVMKYINDNGGEICGDYHDKIEKRVMLNDDGTPVLYKSGANKGKIKYAGSQLISSINMALFNKGQLNVLSIKNKASDELKISVGAVIFTSPLCDLIDEFRYRFNKLAFAANYVRIYKIFVKNTIEQKALSKEKETPTHKIIGKNNITFTENNFEDFVCDN